VLLIIFIRGKNVDVHARETDVVSNEDEKDREE